MKTPRLGSGTTSSGSSCSGIGRGLVAGLVAGLLLLAPVSPVGADTRSRKANVYVGNPYCTEGRATMTHTRAYYLKIVGTTGRTDNVAGGDFFGVTYCTTFGIGLPGGYIKVALLTANTSTGQWCTWTGWVKNRNGSGTAQSRAAGFNWDVLKRPPCGPGRYVLATNHLVLNGGWNGGPLKTRTHWFS